MQTLIAIIALILGGFYLFTLFSNCDYTKPITELPAFCNRK